MEGRKGGGKEGRKEGTKEGRNKKGFFFFKDHKKETKGTNVCTEASKGVFVHTTGFNVLASCSGNIKDCLKASRKCAVERVGGRTEADGKIRTQDHSEWKQDP